MLRLILTLASLLLAPFVPASLPGAAPAPDGGDGGGASERPGLVVSHAELPARTGWFLVPVTADAATRFDLSFEGAARDTDDAPSQALGLVVMPGGRVYALPFGAWRAPWVAASHGGEGVACCGALPQALHAQASESSASFGPVQLEVGAGETLWVGLVAADWEEGSRMEIVLLAKDAALRPGAARAGTRVAAVDLVERAGAAGTNVRLDGVLLAGAAGEARVDLRPQGTGLLLVDYLSSGGPRARLVVDHAEGRVLDAQVDDVVGRLLLAKPGAASVALGDLRGPAPPERVEGRGTIRARLLYADLDLPLRHEEAWEDPWVA